MKRLHAWKLASALVLLWSGSAISLAQVFTSLANFDGNSGAYPQFGNLVQGFDGSLYGTTSSSGSNAGSVFKITPSGNLTTLYRFCMGDGCLHGNQPWGGLLLAIDGSFYGTTVYGGTSSQGTIFRMSREGSLTTLHSFDGIDGTSPYGTLIQGRDGDLYGTTFYGGGGSCNDGFALGCGTIFRITVNGTLTVLHSFTGADGSYPIAGLVQASDGKFYGVTAHGGANNNCIEGCGTAFRITPSGVFKTLHNFDNSDGWDPLGALTQGADGNLYGTTARGGPIDDDGTIFKLTRSGTLTTLYGFSNSSGFEVYAGLVQATDGNFYGTTSQSGGGIENEYGTVFKFTSDGTLTVLHNFNLSDGSYPYGGLVQSSNGILYGTTEDGGTSDHGTVFSVDVGLKPFVRFVRGYGRVGQTGPILGQGFTGATQVSLNGTPATFRVVSDTYIRATVPLGATSGYVTVATPGGTLTSNKPFIVLP